MRRSLYVTIIILILAVTLLGACGGSAGTSTTTPRPSPSPPGFALTSTWFKDGQPLPAESSLSGGNRPPPLHWDGGPSARKSYVLIMDDLDAQGGVYTHWIVFDIPLSANTIKENMAQGKNSGGGNGYRGPSPPSGKHHYYFTLYALDTVLGLQAGADRTTVEKAMAGHIIGQTSLMGTYSK
jgi:Raf kinase inhibitor-like YbhB/YbcL family protein